MDNKGILTVVSGFSGAGKGTVINALLKNHEDYALSISMTTRAPREGEEEGKHYFFVTKDEFEDEINAGGLLEYANYCGNYYGTPRSYVEKCLEEGKNVLLEIEEQGAVKIKEIMPNAVLIFVIAPSADELKDRLIGRGTENLDTVKKRLNRAVEEADGVKDYDFVVINNDPDECAMHVDEIIRASKQRTGHYVKTVEKIKEDLKNILKGDIS